MLTGCTPGPSLLNNSFVVHVAAPECLSELDSVPLLLRYEQVRAVGDGAGREPSSGYFRAGGDTTAYSRMIPVGDCRKAGGRVQAVRRLIGGLSDESSNPGVSGDVHLQAWRTSYDWTVAYPFEVQVGHRHDTAVRYASATNDRYRIDNEHVYVGLLDLTGSEPRWATPVRDPHAAETLGDRQVCLVDRNGRDRWDPVPEHCQVTDFAHADPLTFEPFRYEPTKSQ